MSEQSFEKVKKGVVKRKTRRVVGVFIDGTSLDRATRRMQNESICQSLYVELPPVQLQRWLDTTPLFLTKMTHDKERFLMQCETPGSKSSLNDSPQKASHDRSP
jgi:hypothetical protein